MLSMCGNPAAKFCQSVEIQTIYLEIMEIMTKSWNLVKIYQKYRNVIHVQNGQNFLEFQSLKLPKKSGIPTSSMGGRAL